MGRSERSQGLAPPSIRKDIRAKQARHIIKKIVPGILASNPRARRGVEGSEVIVDPEPVARSEETGLDEKEKQDGEGVQYVKRKGQGRRKVKSGEEEFGIRAERDKGKRTKRRRDNALEDEFLGLSLQLQTPTEPAKHAHDRSEKLRIRIIVTDTLTAAHMLAFPSIYPDTTNMPSAPKPANTKKKQNICILNMASPLRPGGGVLAGATSQEEFLCARTTLLPSLKEPFYRLPEIGGVYTHDVLVFRDSSLPLGDVKGELGPEKRYWVDVVSAGMLRFPELEGGEGDEGKRLSRKDRELAERKMRAVLRIVCAKGAKRIVLGPWGCGAYGNPVKDIACAWCTVLEGKFDRGRSKRGRGAEAETWDGIEDIVFAITNEKMAGEFAKAFGGGIEVEAGPGGDVDNDEEEVEDEVAEELRGKIQEVEGQLGQVWNPDLKSRMGVILEGLKAQLKEREGGDEADDNEDDSAEESLSDDEGIDVHQMENEESSEEDELDDGREAEESQEGGEGRGCHLPSRDRERNVNAC